MKAFPGKGFFLCDRYRSIKMRGYNPYGVKLSALALFLRRCYMNMVIEFFVSL